MATRVHIAASQGTSKEEFSKTFSQALSVDEGQLEVKVTGDWCYLTASVWGVSGKDLDGALSSLPGPALRATTEDDARWYLRVFKQGEEPGFCCHEFSLLDPDEIDDEYEEDEEAEEIEELGECFELCGMPVPDELMAQLKTMSLADAQTRLVAWQAERVTELLTRFDIAHDADSIAAVLEGEGVSEDELMSGVGNLPRFLVGLGLESFEEWIESIQEETACEVEEDRAATKSRFMEAQLALNGWKDVDDEPVKVGVADLRYVNRLGWFCDTTADTYLAVMLPKGRAFELDEGFLRLSEHGTRYLRTFDTASLEHDDFVTSLRGELSGLPDGTVIELVVHSDDMPLANQGYAGTVYGDEWQIERSSPELSVEALTRALALSEFVDGDEPFEAVSDDEAQAIADRIKRDDLLADEKKITLDGRMIHCARFARIWIGRLFFYERFDEAWSAREIERLHREADEESERELEQLFKSFEAPHSGEVLFVGKMSQFMAAS